MQNLIELAKQIASTIEEYEHARVISHNDADGISSAAIICQALLRKGIPYHLTIIGRLDESVAEVVNETTTSAPFERFDETSHFLVPIAAPLGEPVKLGVLEP